MASLGFENVSKRFPDGTLALAGVDLDVAHGEFMVLVGPSGCGKTTLLRSAAGLEEITSGEIRLGGRVVTDLDPGERDVAMVFQNYALYPHMTVRQNLAFGLEQRRLSCAEIAKRVAATAGTLGLDRLLDRKPAALSGGQRQRVAMGRAIVREPACYLMDEPLSNLDANLRVQMRSELKLLNTKLGVTTLYVTHDQVEAMTMGDRVAVLSPVSHPEDHNLAAMRPAGGALQQPGQPIRGGVHWQPGNEFCAGSRGARWGGPRTLDFRTAVAAPGWRAGCHASPASRTLARPLRDSRHSARVLLARCGRPGLSRRRRRDGRNDRRRRAICFSSSRSRPDRSRSALQRRPYHTAVNK